MYCSLLIIFMILHWALSSWSISVKLEDSKLGVCLATTQKRVIISASLMAGLLVIQPCVWSTFVAARVPC